MTILVCGEALVDLVPVHDGPLLAPKLGGGPFNVAVSLGRLGSSVAFLSRVSTDPFGEQILASLQDAGVDTSWIQRGDEPTTLAMTTLAEDGSAQYSFYADGTADRLVRDPGALPDEIDVLSFGTLSLLYEPGASMYAALLHRAHGQVDDGRSEHPSGGDRQHQWRHHRRRIPASFQNVAAGRRHPEGVGGRFSLAGIG